MMEEHLVAGDEEQRELPYFFQPFFKLDEGP